MMGNDLKNSIIDGIEGREALDYCGFDSNPLDFCLKRAYEKWGDRPYLHHEGGVIKDKTFGEFIRDVNYVAKYLLDNGFKGSNIGIFSPNSIEWMTIDIAVMNYVGISAGFPKEWNANDVSYGLKKCDISLLFYSRALADVVNEVRGEFPDVRFICIEDEWESILSQGKGSLEGMRVNRTTDSDADVLETGFSFKFADNDANGLRDDFSSQPADRNRDSLGEGIQLHPVDQDSVVRIVFTSGTTSFPKAVMLTMTNIFAGWRSLARRVSVGPEDVCYLFLPLNHTYGGIFNFIYSLVFGFRVCLTTSIRNMAQEMMQIRPSIFCAVPIVLTRLQAGAEQAGISVSTLMGGKMRYLFCGGAPLTPELRQAYLDAGIEVLNAYALSETSSSLSIDYPGDPVNNSAGTIFEDIEVKVVNPDADDCSRMDDSGADAYGEIAVRGDNVFAGYYGDEAATAAVMTEDGFFLTGDIGCINDNHIYLKGRKDSRLVFANGEKISAAAVSERVQGLDERIKSVKVYIRDNTLTCDIYVAFGQDKTISSGADNEIFGKLQQLIDTMNQQVSKYERVGKYNIYNADRLLK